jgi:predicted secreted protein
MTNPTSNFGWQMPTSTDLVTDLPADFEVFGQAVDTSLADLKGGTTGQVLKKNTNADMDFVWSADAAGMTNPMTTTGDTIYSSSGSTPARLGIGTTGQVLTVSSGVPAWTTPASGSMTLLATGTFNSTADIVFSSISGAYKDLYLVFNSVNVWASGSGDRGFIRLNGNTGAVYNWQISNAGGGSTRSVSDTKFDQSYAIGDVGAAKTGSSYFRIRDYANSSAYKGVDGMNIC